MAVTHPDDGVEPAGLDGGAGPVSAGATRRVARPRGDRARPGARRQELGQRRLQGVLDEGGAGFFAEARPEVAGAGLERPARGHEDEQEPAGALALLLEPAVVLAVRNARSEFGRSSFGAIAARSRGRHGVGAEEAAHREDLRVGIARGGGRAVA